jgi:hypothetical protein
VLLAAPGVINFLESHGFFMFKDLFSADFDQLLTELKIDQIVKLISSGDEYIADYYFRHKNLLEENFVQLAEYKYQQSILNVAITFVEKNIK